MPEPDLRRDVAKEARLWGLAVVCAAAGAIAVSLTDSFGIGICVFLAVLGIGGPILYGYEKRRKARTAAPEGRGAGSASRADRPKHGGHRKRPPRRT